MALQLVKAQRKQAKLRLEISAASWAGKTMSSILLAKGLAWGDLSKVCLIDTENGSGHLYSHLWEYSVINVKPDEATTDNILEAFKLAEDNWFEVIIFDSSSHWRDFILSKNEENAKRMYGNSFKAWAETTPLYDKLVRHILWSPCHVIVTARKKQEYALETNDQGKTVVKKLWMKDVQRDTMEYEFTTVLNIDQFHYATVSKDRTGLYDGKDPFIITEEVGKTFKEWCESGAEIKPKEWIDDDAFETLIDMLGRNESTVKEILERFNVSEKQKEVLREMVKNNKCKYE